MENTTSPYFSVVPDLGIDVVRFSRPDVVDSVYIERLGIDLLRYVSALNHPNIVLDMENVRQLSSAALGVLVALNNTVNMREGRLCIASLDPKLREVFKLTKLSKVFAICDDLPSAKRHVAGRR